MASGVVIEPVRPDSSPEWELPDRAAGWLAKLISPERQIERGQAAGRLDGVLYIVRRTSACDWLPEQRAFVSDSFRICVRRMTAIDHR